MLLLEEVAYDLRLPLTSAQVAANAGHQLGAVAGAAFPQTIGLDVLVQQLIRVEFRAIAWQPDQAQAPGGRPNSSTCGHPKLLHLSGV